MAKESKVQKVARKAGPVVQRRVGSCGHEVIRVLCAPQTGKARPKWYCETCSVFQDKGAQE